MKTEQMTRTLSFMVPDTLVERIELLANRETRTKSNLIRRAIEQYLEQNLNSVA